jgi:hypothetical protein
MSIRQIEPVICQQDLSGASVRNVSSSSLAEKPTEMSLLHDGTS